MRESLSSFYQGNVKSRYDDTRYKNQFLQEREELKNKIYSKKEADKKLMDIISTDSTTPQFDLNTCISMYKEIALSNHQSELLERVHTLISKKKEEIYRSDLKKIGNNAKEGKHVALKHIEDIKINSWIISDETMKKLYELA